MQILSLEFVPDPEIHDCAAARYPQALDELCEGKFALDRDSKEPVPSDWDEYGVADLNDTCASTPLVSCWNSTKRLVGPGCAKTYEWKREKEVRFGWLTTRIKPECERLISE